MKGHNHNPPSLVRGPKILVVDDDQDTCTLVRLTLEAANFEVVEAESGQVALARLQEETFSAVLIDIAMPGMDGTSVIEALPQIAGSQHLPIVVMTALYPEGRRERQALETGAVGVLHKPFHPRQLLATLMEHCAFG